MLESSIADKNVVLLGIGHTNAHIVKQWARQPISDHRLICISNYSQATYSGMLPGTLGGQFAPAGMQIDLPALTRKANAQLVIGLISGLDQENRLLLFDDRPPIPFETLSIGIGSMPSGWRQYSHLDSFVAIKPMQSFLTRLEDHLQKLKTFNEPLHIAIVGGGVASIEIACCLQQKLQRNFATNSIHIDIFAGHDHIATDLRPRSRRMLEKVLQFRNIAVHVGQRVTDVTACDLLTDDGVRHPAHCTLWATNSAPPHILPDLGLQGDSRGFIATSNTLQSLTNPRIFAVGDSGTILASPTPKAGVYAVRQSPILWHNLQALISGHKLRTYHPQSDFLKLINTGDGKAILEYGPFSTHAKWCWTLKTWIDKRFVASFQ